MIKDRGQKQLAIKYCAVQGLIPFPEVIVRSATGLEDSPVDITDVDVIGIELSTAGAIRRTMFDCKTANRQSAINRALWAYGLKSLVNADAAYIIQIRPAPDSHKLMASSFSVYIHTEISFRRFATSMSANFMRDVSYLDNMDTWDKLFGMSQRNSNLSDLAFFVTTQVALERSGPRGLRSGLSAILHTSGELDPRQASHNLLFRCYLTSFLLSASICISALKGAFEFGMTKADFESRLRNFLWEGRENYVIRYKLRRALIERGGAASEEIEFDLPEWSKLVELMRAYLEAPEALTELPLLVKELGFRCLSHPIKLEADDRIVATFSKNNRARQFIFIASDYVCSASDLPKEFSRRLEDDINGLLT